MHVGEVRAVCRTLPRNAAEMGDLSEIIRQHQATVRGGR
jgi:hypothetical protein